MLTGPLPGYRVTVRNVASQSVALFRVQAFRGTALTRLEPASRATRAMVPRDLDGFEASPGRDSGEGRCWIERMIVKYEAWLKRLAASKRTRTTEPAMT